MLDGNLFGIRTYIMLRSKIYVPCGLAFGLMVSSGRLIGQPVTIPESYTYESSYTVKTLAGSPWVSGSADGVGNTARFYLPTGIAVDKQGNLYVAEPLNGTIRKILPNGTVTTLAAGERRGRRSR